MALALTAGLPPFFTLENGYVVRVTAQDATTGARLSSVVISELSISVDLEDLDTATGATDDQLVDTPWLVPLAS